MSECDENGVPEKQLRFTISKLETIENTNSQYDQPYTRRESSTASSTPEPVETIKPKGRYDLLIFCFQDL